MKVSSQVMKLICGKEVMELTKRPLFTGEIFHEFQNFSRLNKKKLIKLIWFITFDTGETKEILIGTFDYSKIDYKYKEPKPKKQNADVDWNIKWLD